MRVKNEKGKENDEDDCVLVSKVHGISSLIFLQVSSKNRHKRIYIYIPVYLLKTHVYLLYFV